MTRMGFAALALAVGLATRSAGAQNLVVNGDFSAGLDGSAAESVARGGTGYNGTIADFDDVTIVAVTTTTTSSSTTTTAPGPCGGLAAPDAVACLCDADLPAPCREVNVPRRLGTRFEKACRTALRAIKAGPTRKSRQRLATASRQMTALVRAVGKLRRDPACVAALVERGQQVDSRIDEVRASMTP